MTLTEIIQDFTNQFLASEHRLLKLQQQLQEEQQRFFKLHGAVEALQVVKDNTDGCK